jgi:hypothetical protein
MGFQKTRNSENIPILEPFHMHITNFKISMASIDKLTNIKHTNSTDYDLDCQHFNNHIVFLLSIPNLILIF